MASMKIAVLLSGGVDSSVALNLLLRQGYTDVCAYYLKIWLEDEMAYMGSCPWEEDLAYAEAVCSQAGVPLRVLPLQQEYYDRVVEYAVSELRAGRTPSPDIFCNQRIKFGAFWDKLQEDYDYVATGHYARIERIRSDQTPPSFVHRNSIVGAADLCLLRRAPDPVKDQSYFLSHLSQEQLQRILFPLGDYTKAQVRELAQEFDLPTKDRKDSQGICFLGKIRYPEFVGHYLGEQDGPIIERESGKELGRHKGYWYYTIGQRQGIGLGNGPWYVVGKDVDQNVVYISHSSHRDEARRSTFRIENLSWTIPEPEQTGFPAGSWGQEYTLLTKLRHGPELISCTLDPLSGRMQLNDGDQGIAPGQFAVLYAGEYCIGGGRICADELSSGKISGRTDSSDASSGETSDAKKVGSRVEFLTGERKHPDREGFTSPYPVSLAPMMDRTDRFFRWFLRQITPNTLLYTEMISTGAIVYGERSRHLDFYPEEKPIALQLGGSDPWELGKAVAIADDWEYDEINLNVGCPSDRVQHRGIGACLMAEPDKVARLVDIMRKNTSKPVTVKHRIGIDGRESFEELCQFVEQVAASGVERLTVHARIAILAGLSPKENRTIPPLRYEDVYRLKQEYPNLEIEINGHIDSVDSIRRHLTHVDAVMLGRAAYDNPYLFADIEREIFRSRTHVPDRREIIDRLIVFLETRWDSDYPRPPLGHIMGLYHGMPGARRWRGTISTELSAGTSAPEVLRKAMEQLPASAD
ncbi:hypothetical protein JCM12856_05790 [Spirochaeta dissipatitropha]